MASTLFAPALFAPALFAAALMASAAATEAQDMDAVDGIAERGTMRLGFRTDAPPFSYRGEDGGPAGLAVMLCDRVADRVAEAVGIDDLQREWVAVTARTRFEAIAERRIDLLCGPTSQTISRRRSMDFSIPYFIDGAGVVLRKGGPETLADITDEAVGVLGGTTTEKFLPRLLKRFGATSRIVAYDSHVAGLTALQNGEIEAYVGDSSILAYQLGRLQPSVQPVIEPRTYSSEFYALAMLRGETELRLLVDDALSRMYDGDEIFQLIEQALGRLKIDARTEAIYRVVPIPR